MDLKLCLADRSWVPEQHLRHFTDGLWTPMRNPDGEKLAGIDGLRGIRARKQDGTYIGADFIRMRPGSSFPVHSHDGDHEIYFIDGRGFVQIDGNDIPVTVGNVIHIPAEHPHNVWVPQDADAALVFVAIGHPHRHVDAPDRMQLAIDEKTYRKQFSPS